MLTNEQQTGGGVNDRPEADPPSTPSVNRATPLQFLKGVGPARAQRLERLGLKTAGDALFFFPRDYEHPPPPTRVSDLAEGVAATFIGRITEADLVSRTPGKSIFGLLVENDSGAVRAIFFNQAFRADHLLLDAIVQLSGPPKLAGMRWEFVHPRVEVLHGPGDEAGKDLAAVQQAARAAGRIEAVYPMTEGLRQNDIRRLTATLCEQLAPGLAEALPATLRAAAGEAIAEHSKKAKTAVPPDPLPGIAGAVTQMHLPDSDASLAAARRRLVFQELLTLQLALAIKRHAATSHLKATPIEIDSATRGKIIAGFPFELTGDQRRVIDELTVDLRRQYPMNRMLQGDVGSGKTVVAFYAMMAAAAAGHQATMMAPTEVLARQHFATIDKFLGDSGASVEFLGGGMPAGHRRRVLERIKTGQVDLVIGTQALLHGVEFASLAVCIIDEQHKFGVAQRVSLRRGGVDPHTLVMSATPIPRSMAMTQFGDVDLSTIRQKPAGRGVVHTYLGDDKWRPRWWQFIRDRVAEGRQAFVVVPRVGQEVAIDVEQDDATTSTSVVQTHQSLSSGPLSGLRVELLHGRMDTETKQRVMRDFAEGEIDVLVCTTVIEVGVDVPNASVMTILGAERFGLAQLHQLRGRVGRGAHPGHVCVFTDGGGSPEEAKRLRVFESTYDGFELAEADFKLRGPGDVMGQRQSGLPPMKIADLRTDIVELLAARQVARQLIDEDPAMEGEGLELLRTQVMRRYGQRLELGDTA